MKQYINKDALAAEIEKRLNYRNKELDAINNGTFWDEEQSEDTFNEALTTCAYNAVKNELFELRCFLDIVETIEVKEEVTTTDTFIDKAEKWLNEHILDYVYAKEWGQGVGVEGELFDDFKNAMKGE